MSSLSGHTLLQLIWLASPALPVGGFSYSEGLESAVETGLVTDEAGATAWLLAQLRLGLARADLPLLAQAVAGWRANDLARIAELNDWFRQTRESAELRAQSEQMGRSLVEWLRNGGAGGEPGDATDARIEQLAALAPAPNWAIAFALAAARTNASVDEALLTFAFGWAENMAQAAMKTVPLGQAAAQRMLAALAAAIPEVVAQAEATGDDERIAFTPMLAILSAQHEIQYSRLFRS